MKNLFVISCGIISLVLLNIDNPYWWVFSIPLDLELLHMFIKDFKESLK